MLSANFRNHCLEALVNRASQKGCPLALYSCGFQRGMLGDALSTRNSGYLPGIFYPRRLLYQRAHLAPPFALLTLLVLPVAPDGAQQGQRHEREHHGKGQRKNDHRRLHRF